MAWIRGKLLGAGAFGSVNLAIKRECGEVFAVKSVVVGDESAAAVRAIENELRMLQELESRFVVRCLGSDWSAEGGQLRRNVFLEYMPEGCLTDFVKQFSSGGGLDEHLLRTYTRSVVEGIQYLHSRGIVHCDVKGKNVLVGNGCVKLTDFGSAKRVGAGAGAATEKVEQVNGTPLWMAPEVVRQVEQGPASDIWSLGCTVVEMATGRAPWSNLAGMNPFVALYHIGCTDALPAVPASLSADAHDFLSHCFQRDPRRRWTSAQLLQHPFLTDRFAPAPAPASPTSALESPAAPSLRKRGLVSAPPSLRAVSVEENSWIVVRSPKSASSPPSFALSDWTASPAPPSAAADAPIAPTRCDNFDPRCEPPHAAPHRSTLSPATSPPPPHSAASRDAPVPQSFASRSGAPRFAISETSHRIAGSEKLRSFARDRVHRAPGLEGFCLRFAVSSRSADQCANPRIRLFWWRRRRAGLLENSHHRGSHRVWLNCGHWDQCIIAFLDQYTIDSSKTATFLISSHVFVCLFVCIVCIF